MLNRLHAMEIVTLSKMLGGWGQPLVANKVIGSSSQGVVVNVATYSNHFDPMYVDSYKGTPGLRWKEVIVSETKIVSQSADVSDVTTTNGKGSAKAEITESIAVETADAVSVAPSSSSCGAAVLEPPVVESEPVATSSRNITKLAKQPSLLSAWGAGGTWHEHNGSVFASEEVFFPTVLSLLGYLRDSTRTDSGDITSTGVKIAAVTFAEWAKKGDANPIAYDYFDAQLVQRMRVSGAVFGRKFAQNSVTVSEWSRAVEDCSASNNSQRGSYGRQYSSQGRYHDDYNNTRNHNSQHSYRNDDDRYSNYSSNDRSYNDNDRYRNNRYDNNRGYDQRNYDNRSYGDNRYDSHGGRDYSDSKRRKY